MKLTFMALVLVTLLSSCGGHLPVGLNWPFSSNKQAGVATGPEPSVPSPQPRPHRLDSLGARRATRVFATDDAVAAECAATEIPRARSPATSRTVATQSAH